MIERVKQWLYYIIIGAISFIALVFLPMIGTKIGLAWSIPNTTVGWIVWVTVKLIVAVINVMIFHCFMLQAKINIKDNARYIMACDMCRTHDRMQRHKPRAPGKWIAEQYAKKGTVIFLTTAMSTVALTQALLTFDYMSMLTYLFTIIMGLIFGVMQMKTAEEYWTNEFYEYALDAQKEQEHGNNDRREDISQSSGTSAGEQTQN